MARSNTAPQPIPFGNMGSNWEYFLEDIEHFAAGFGGVTLYPYQLEVAHAIIRSVINGYGDTIVVMFSRQGGKNETSAQIEAYFMALMQGLGGTTVKVAPTYIPQVVNSKLRLEKILRHDLLKPYFKPRMGYIYQFGDFQQIFFSGGKQSKIVGATAKVLIEVDEAQDIDPDKFEKDIAPMGLTTNATTVFWGTAWTGNTLIEQKAEACKQLEKELGRQLYFEYNADIVRRYNPAYGKYVDTKVRELGRQHPMIKTQYFLEKIEEYGKLFDQQRQVLMQGDHAREYAPKRDKDTGKVIQKPGCFTIALIDNAGEDEQESLAVSTMVENMVPKRDFTVCAIVEVDLSKQSQLDPWPYLRLLDIKELPNGARMTDQLMILLNYLNHWEPQAVVNDSIGVGETTGSFLQQNYRKGWSSWFFRYKATAQSKSEAGFDLLTMVDTGHFKMWANDGSKEYQEFWHQIDKCQKLMKNAGLMNYYVEQKDGHDDYISLLHFMSLLARMYRDGVSRSQVQQLPDPHVVNGPDPSPDKIKAYEEAQRKKMASQPVVNFEFERKSYNTGIFDDD